jgi:exonuclease SbcD
MTDPIRVLHFADVHIGMENYGRTDPNTGLSTRVVDFLRRMDDMIEYAREHEVDLSVFAGDAFKTRSPNPTFQREFAHRVRDLAELGPVVLLIGNHDVAPTLMKASSVEIYETLAVPNVIVADSYEVRQVETRRGPVIIGTAPYPIRSRILEHVPTMGLTIKQTDAILSEQLVEILDDLATEADQLAAQVGEGTPRLLTGHFTVSGAVVSSERAIMLGRDVDVPKMSVADPRWDYVALGHIHKHQNLTQGQDDVPPVVYSGSLERIDFGEEGDTKGFCWVDLAHGATSWEFIPAAARPFFTLRLDLRTDTNPTQTVIQELERFALQNAVVRLLLQFSPESEARFNESSVRDALKRAQVFYIAVIRKEIEQPTRARLGASPEGLTHRELLERYLLSKEVEPERRAELMEAAEEIFDENEPS